MRRISIVFQETNDKNVAQGQSYIVFMDGHDSARMKLPDEKLSAAEFWARKCFGIVINAINMAGAIVSVQEPKSGQ